ncbi:MAG: polymer-forming cytoskeletal protein [Spirochaetaceae bacterium]|jgi:cytoskeletal protein CcmA (bactofilin family)|nr:polymer-forming cytoskeletal protein [Spirochaetaceae bacterium]
MAGRKRTDFLLNTIIGPGTQVHGTIETAGFTRIDGSIQGDVSVRGRVAIGEKARLKSNLRGTSITVGGVIYGNVIATERLVILSTGLILGDIITRRIQVDEGCLIHGKVRVCHNDEQWEEAMAELQEAIELPDVFPLPLKRSS